MLDPISLKDALKFIVDNRGKTAPTAETGHKLIATNCVSNRDLYPIYENFRYVSQETYDTWFRAHPKPFDILLTNKGSQNGAVCLVPDPVDFCIAQDMMALRADVAKIDPLYLFAALRSVGIQSAIKNLNVDGVIPHFKKTDFDKLFIPRPDPNIQQAIGRLHFELCSKIELNRRMNETLEEMARALFRDWFVTFGPTRRQMEGATDPAAIMGHAFPAGDMPEKVGTGFSPENSHGKSTTKPLTAATLAPLFPAKLGDDGLPEGWEERPLDEIGHFLNGLALQKFPAQDGKPDLPVIKIAELRNGVSPKSNRASTEVPKKYVIGNGDFIFSWSGSLMAKFWTGGAGALNQHLFKVTSESHPMWFVSEWVQSHLEEFQRIAASKAVTMGHIKRSHLAEAMCVCPAADALETFGEVFDPLISKQIANDQENQTLAEMRDLLLPKLMSGEIRLKDVEASL